MKTYLACLLLILHMTAHAASAQTPSAKITVTSLLSQDFVIAGTTAVPSGGLGLLLRKAKKVYFCYLTETQASATVATEYCKPVE
jgi:hypothetical protein